jgi:Fe-S cluster biosynthesis and repair protein YggX
MTRLVFCRKYKQELVGLVNPPLPGQLGNDIYENVSEKAWKEWQSNQTMLINEHRLRLTEPEARKYLMREMHRFFENEEYAQAEGYVPPSS